MRLILRRIEESTPDIKFLSTRKKRTKKALLRLHHKRYGSRKWEQCVKNVTGRVEKLEN